MSHGFPKAKKSEKDFFAFLFSENSWNFES